MSLVQHLDIVQLIGRYGAAAFLLHIITRWLDDSDEHFGDGALGGMAHNY